MAFFNFIRLIDRFPHRLALKSNRKETHSTMLTIFASILIISFFFIYFPSKMLGYMKERPFNLNVTFSRQSKFESRILTPENMKIMSILKETSLASETSSSNKSEETSINTEIDASLNRLTYSPKQQGTKAEEEIIGEIESCASPKAKVEYESFFKYSDFLRNQSESIFCTMPNKSAAVGGEYLLGNSLSVIKAHVPYILSYQEPTKEKKYGSCSKMADSSYFGVVYQHFKPNYNLEVPFEKSILSYSWIIESYKIIDITFVLRKTVVTTDANYLGDFFPTQTNEFYSLKDIKIEKSFQVDPFKAEDKSHCEIDMFYGVEIDDEVVEVNREYEKLDNFVANATGLIGFLSCMFNVSLGFVEGTVFEEEIIRKIYSKSEDKKVNIKHQSEIISDRSSINRLQTIVISNKDSPTETSTDTDKTLFCCRKKRKNKLSENAIKYSAYDFDILTLIKKNLLVESLIKVLLTEEQVNLLNLIDVRPLSKNADEEIQKMKEKFYLSTKISNLTSTFKTTKNALEREDFLTLRIVEEIEKQNK